MRTRSPYLDPAAYTVTVEPAEQPVTLAEAKAHLRVDYDAEDDLITAMIVAATENLEGYLNRCLITRTIRAEYAGLFSGDVQRIARNPVIAVSSVEAWDGATFQTIGADTYEITKEAYPTLCFFSAPSFNGVDKLYPLRVTFTCGYGAAADVPERFKLAIKMIVAELWNNRGDCDTDLDQFAGARRLGLPKAVLMLIGKDRIIRSF